MSWVPVFFPSALIVCVLLFDQLWMSNSGKLKCGSSVHLCTKLKIVETEKKIYTRKERERERGRQQPQWNWNNVNFFVRCDDDEKICTYEIYIRCYTLDLKESLSTWPYEWICGLYIALIARLKLCTRFIIAHRIYSYSLMSSVSLSQYEHTLCLKANQTNIVFSG